MSNIETTEQIAKRIVANVNRKLDQIATGSLPLSRTCEIMAELTILAIVEAMAEEREACAKIAEAPRTTLRNGGPPPPQRIAAEIRARATG